MKGFEDIIITKEEEVKEEDGSCGCDLPDEKDDGGKLLNKSTLDRKTVHVAFVMDHSGSMSLQKKLALDNYNEQLASLKTKAKENGIETYVTLVEFDNRIITKYENRLINEIEPEEYYWTDGMTSLNDAIFNGASLLKKSMANDKCEDKSALLIIMTDGDENSSVEFAGIKGRDLIKKEIETLEKTGDWTFTFMGANINVQDVAVAGYGMSAGNTMSFDANAKGFKMSGGSVQAGLDTYYSARTRGVKSVANFHNHNSTTTNEKPVTTNTVTEEAEE